MAIWMARLDGHEFDLRALSEHLRGPDYAVREMRTSEYYLEARRFQSLAEATAVRDEAIRLIPRINGAARLVNANSKPVAFGGSVISVSEEGRQSVFLFPPPIAVRAAVAVSIDGETMPRLPTVAETLLANADHDQARAEALHLFGLDQDWVNLYRTLEAIEQAAGDEQVATWVSKNKLRRFRHTAGSRRAIGDAARHGPTNETPPANPMSIDEARTLIRELMSRLLMIF